MQSKMTEREFLEELRRLYEAAAPEETVVKMIKRAGLEFAPEPVKVPERLQLMDSVLLPEEGGWLSFEQRIKGYELARDRFNAYPGLRAAAEDLLKQLGRYTSVPRELSDRLRTELAKGPK